MENNKENQAKMLSIMEFIHHYDSKVSIQTLINGTSFAILLSQIPETQYDFSTKINTSAMKWSEQLQNLQTVLFKIEDYFQQIHQKCVQTSNIDLIGLTKRQDLFQLTKLFQLVMSALMQSSAKEYFVQTIMLLQESSQEIFVEIVKNCLSEHNFTPSKYKSNVFNRVISQFQEQKHTMEKQIQRLCKANQDLLSKIKQYEQAVNQVDLDTSRRSMDMSIDDGRNVKYLEEYIDQLQARIVEQSKFYEEEKMNNQDRISDLQYKISKLEEAEQLCKIYKEKYDQIMDQMQKMNIWKRQKAKMEKTLQEKDFIVLKLNDRIQELSQKNLLLEEAELQLKLELEKKELKIQKMSNELKKVMENIGHANSSFSAKLNESIQDQSIRDYVNMKQGEDLIFGSEDQLNKIRKQKEKLLKKCKQYEKDICKLNKKVQKLRTLEQDKSKLEQLIFELRTTQSQQLNLMMAIYYEGFEEQINLTKQMRQNSSDCQDDEGKKERVQRRKERVGSLMLKSKQNLLSSSRFFK